MTTTYVFGSHRLTRLPHLVVTLLEELDTHIIVGDLDSGTDRLVQRVLQAKDTDVTVYYSGKRPLCNLAFSAVQVTSSDKSHGREFFGQKEIEMVAKADNAICLWDNECGVSFKTLLYCFDHNVPVRIIPITDRMLSVPTDYLPFFPADIAKMLITSSNRLYRKWLIENESDPRYVQQG